MKTSTNMHIQKYGGLTVGGLIGWFGVRAIIKRLVPPR